MEGLRGCEKEMTNARMWSGRERLRCVLFVAETIKADSQPFSASVCTCSFFCFQFALQLFFSPLLFLSVLQSCLGMVITGSAATAANSIHSILERSRQVCSLTPLTTRWTDLSCLLHMVESRVFQFGEGASTLN